MFHMEQKDYNLEIVRKLLRSEGHIRSIAVQLGINHMMIVRKMNELLKKNVVDFKQEGKNKVYFLKDSVEARMHVLMAEEYALVRVLKKYPALRKVVENVHRNGKIKLALLFGSYAKGLAKKESDIDLFVETKDQTLKKELQMLNSKLSVKIGKFDKGNLLVDEIKKNHVIIKGFEKYHEGTALFS